MALNANGWASSVEAPTITFEVVVKAVIPYGTGLHEPLSTRGYEVLTGQSSEPGHEES